MTEPTLLCGWGRTSATAARVARPESERAVRELLAPPFERGWIARGLGRAYGDAAQNAGGGVADICGIDAIDLDPATGLLRAGAGASIDEVISRGVPHGWFVPVSPGTRQVTLGGAFAADVHGKNHHADGSFAHHVCEVRLVTPSGTVVASPTERADVFWATAGGMGLTGILVELTVQLLPIPSSRLSIDIRRVSDLDELMTELEAGQARHRYSVAWIDLTPRGRGRGVITQGDFADPGDLPARARTAPHAYARPRTLPAPALPSGVLNGASIAAFNEAWFRRHPRSATAIQTIPTYFHPLDIVEGWNRLYGARGFVQWQCVVPMAAAETLRTVVQRLAASRVPSFLAVLKTFGELQGGPLSFPMPGWTLAIDIPAGVPGLSDALHDLDALVAAAGGRIYLAKDSRMRPELIPVMYPDLDAWRSIQAGLDPHGRMVNDLDRRLRLTEAS